MTILTSDINTRALDILADTSAVRWLSAEVIRWINDGMREVAMAQPEACAVVSNITLVAGTKQTLPAGAIALGTIKRNMGVGGATPADAPRQTTQSLMDRFRPLWHQDTPTLVVQNFMKDARHPRTFYVWPPMSGATQVEAEYSLIPTAVAALTDTVNLPDIYLSPLVDNVCYRCFSKDNEIPGMASKAAAHRSAFDAAFPEVAAGEADEK